MRAAGGVVAVRLLALLALAVSAALLVNDVRPGSPLCAFESACEEVLTSPFARPLGVPLPLVGVVVFGALFGLSLFPAGGAGRLFRPAALAVGAGGLVLLLLQGFVLRRLCPYCTLVDLSAVAAGAVQLVWGRPAAPAPVRFRPVWVAGALVTAGLGAAFGAAAGSAREADRPPPPQVTALWVPGKVNVVEIADFQCPHCRRMHAVVSRFLEEEGDRVHFVRLTAPMPAHAQARDASRAFLCAEAQGRGDEMAEALFRAADLGPDSCERIAAALGLSGPRYRSCVTDPATDTRLDRDLAWVKLATPNGLPVVWVQGRMIQGLRPIEELREAARAAESVTAGRGNVATGED